jgi:hypothetical protein
LAAAARRVRDPLVRTWLLALAKGDRADGERLAVRAELIGGYMAAAARVRSEPEIKAAGVHPLDAGRKGRSPSP